jgi:hypothetical protein
VALERLRDDSWVEISRYGSAEEAALGLDEQIAVGVAAAELRLKPLEHGRHKGLLHHRSD